MLKRLLVYVFALLFTVSFAATAAYAGEAEAVMKMLLKKGIISQKDYDEVMSELKTEAPAEGEAGKAEASEGDGHEDKHQLHAKGPLPDFLDGLKVGGNVLMVGQGTAGNNRNKPSGTDITNGNMRAQLEVSRPLGENGELFFKTEADAGKGLADDARLNSFWGVNGTAGDTDSRLWIREFWYTHNFLDKKLTLTIGKLDITNYFDTNAVANSEGDQFLSGGFVNNTAIEFPSYTAGVRLTASLSELACISVGWQPGNTAWENVLSQPFYIGEIDLKPKIAGRDGNYRLYTWYNGTHHTLIDDPTVVNRSGWGIGTSLDQQIVDNLTFFGRFGYQDRSVYDYDMAWSAGLGISGKPWGRDEDTLAAAYGMAILSPDYRDSLRASGITPANEQHAEVYYSIAVNKFIKISPDIQYVANANGNDAFHNAWVFGLRAKVIF